MVSCDLSIVFLVTYEGPAFIVLFLDTYNVVSSHFLTVCTMQVSVPAFATKRTSMEGHNLYVTSVAIAGMYACVDFCMAPSLREIFLFKVRQL